MDKYPGQPDNCPTEEQNPGQLTSGEGQSTNTIVFKTFPSITLFQTTTQTTTIAQLPPG